MLLMIEMQKMMIDDIDNDIDDDENYGIFGNTMMVLELVIILSVLSMLILVIISLDLKYTIL